MNTEEKAEFKAVYSTLKKKRKTSFYMFRKLNSRTAYKWSWSPGKGRQTAKEQVESHPTPPCPQLLVQQNGLLKARVIFLHGLSPSSFTHLLDTQNPPSLQLVSRDSLPGVWRAHRCWDLTIKTFSRGITWSVVWAVESGMQV